VRHRRKSAIAMAAALTAALAMVSGAFGATITGTSASELLVGTKQPDIIWGLGGNDRIDGLRRGDELRGGPGVDIVWGRSGADTIYGGRGGDRLRAGYGMDTVTAGPGNDAVWVAGDAAVDTVDCGTGVDVVYADTEDVLAANCETEITPP